MATAANAYVSAARALGVDKGEALRYVEAAFGRAADPAAPGDQPNSSRVIAARAGSSSGMR
jgi:hypothetical protein